MMRAIRRIAILACLALIGGVTYWYLGPGQPSPQQKQAQQKGPGFRRGGGNPNDTVPVLAIAARLADVPVYLDGVGTAKALNTVLVRSQVDGKLMKIDFKEGQEVTQGSGIAKIDPTTYQAQYDIAVAKKAQDEALLANAKLDLERYMRLAATNAVQKQQVDTQKATVDQLTAQTQSDQASINNAKATLDYTDVVAPLTGLTGIRQVDEGNIIHASDATGIVTSTARPRPSDITTDGVTAPGRWMFAIASRSMVMRVRGRRRATAIRIAAMPRNSANTTIEEATNTAATRLS